MKLTIDRNTLIKPLSHANAVIERRNTIPVLSNVVLRAENNSLIITATDMDMDIIETVQAAVAEPGVITTPAQIINDIARKLPDGAEVEIAAADAGQISVKAGRSNFNLPTLPAEDFPIITDQAMTTEFTLAATELKVLLGKTRFAVSNEETRYYLNGIYLHLVEGNILRVVSTDGHRLARSQMAQPNGAKKMPPVIIPRKTVGELSKLIDEYDGDVKIGLTETRAQFSFGNIEVNTKLIDAKFPDYQSVIPTNNNNIMQVSAGAFKEAVDRVSTVSLEKTRSVKLRLTKDLLTLSSSNSDSASGEETLEVSYQGEDIEIGFNAHYLIQVAEHVDGDVIEFAFADSALPSLIRAPGDESNLFILMPMRV